MWSEANMVGEDDTLSSKSKVDMVRLPPCQDSLIPHIQRVNHRVACYKHSAQAIFEKPESDSESQGWLRSDDGVLEPVWSIGPILPPSLLKLLDTCDTENDNDENDCIDAEPNLEDDVEIDYDDMLTEDDY